jgi:hypothetical protein
MPIFTEDGEERQTPSIRPPEVLDRKKSADELLISSKQLLNLFLTKGRI